MPNRYLLFVGLSVAALSLAGCTQAENPPESSTTGTDGSAGSSSPAAARSSVFSPLTSIVDYWRDNPGVADKRARVGTVLLNEPGTDAGRFALPGAEAQDAVLVVLVCDRESDYEVTIGNAATPELARTWGESCGGPTINTYTTKPHDPLNPGTVPDHLQVNVPPGVNYYVTAYGVAGT